MAITLAISLPHCGSDPHAPPPETGGALPDTEGDCLNCGMQVEDANAGLDGASPAVSILPDSLAFYGTLEATAGLGPQAVRISNPTIHVALVSTVLIADHPEAMGGMGGGAYFEIVGGGPLGIIPLAPGEEIELSVEFLMSTEQRAAMLMVFTTDPDAPVLEVDLRGKVFLN